MRLVTALVLSVILASIYFGASAFEATKSSNSSIGATSSLTVSSSSVNTTILYCHAIPPSGGNSSVKVPSPIIVALLPQIQSSPAVIQAEANYSSLSWGIIQTELLNITTTLLVNGTYVTTYSQQWSMTLYALNQSAASIDPCSPFRVPVVASMGVNIPITILGSPSTVNMTGIYAQFFNDNCDPRCP